MPIDFNYFNITLLFGALIAFVSASLVYYQKSKRLVNRTWFWLNVFVVVWSLGYATMISTNSFDIAKYVNHILHGVAIFIPVLFLQFVAALTKQSLKYIKKIRIFYVIAFVFIALNPTAWLLTDVKAKFVFKYVSDAGPFFIYYTAFFVILVIYAEYVLFRAILKAKGLHRSQMLYIFIATVIGFTGGSSVFFLTLNVDFPPYPMILYATYPIVVTYSIIRYRSFDIRSIIFRSFGFSFIILLSTGLLAFITAILSRLAGIESVVVISLLIAFLVSISYRPLHGVVEHITKNILYKMTYNPNTVLGNVTDLTSSLLNVKELLSKVSDIILNTFHTDKISFLLIDENKNLSIPYQFGFLQDIAKGIIQRKDILSVIDAQYKRFPGIQVIEELKTLYDNGEYEPADPELLNLLYEHDVALVIPLKEKEQLSGVIVIGNKKSGDPYSLEDLRILNIVTGQIAIAIKNALLYEEQRQFAVTLKKEVERQTKELQLANKKLKKLDLAKSEFLSIAAHQLRTPLTGIKGYLSMFLEGDFGEFTKKQTDEIEKIFKSSDRLTRLIDVFLNISRIETGRLDIKKTKVKLDELLDEVVGSLSNQAKEKNIEITVQKPSEELPEMMLDRDKVHDVMMNLVDNAIKYTQKGWVNARMSRSKSLVTFEVRDSGIGINPIEIDKLFQKFSRAEAVTRIHTGGSGLGLFIAKKIVEAHGGRIWAESEGEGSGSMFAFTLPIEEEEK